MSFESMDFAYHRGMDNKFTYTFQWKQILVILCKRLYIVYQTKMLKNQTQTGRGAQMCSAFDCDTAFPRFLGLAY